MESFVGRGPIPIRHGLTLAELLTLLDRHERIGADLRVVAMRGWRRSMRFEDTGLPWIPPSPNMPTTDTARVYPGGCLVEGTNLSEGRGTTRPFEWVGAPWIDSRRLARELDGIDLPGVRFGEARFRPMFQKHAGSGCGGVFVHVSDADAFRPFRTYLELIAACRRQDPARFAWRAEAYEFVTDRPAIDLLLGRSDVRPAWEAGTPVEALERIWTNDLEAYRSVWSSHLVYD
jgi:uncharacterized protein YbbC (DUF1343 family)